MAFTQTQLQRPWLSATAIFAMLLCACSEPDSPEAQIRQAVDAMEKAAEERDVSDVMAFVADDFRDGYGQGTVELRQYLAGYFIANQSIHLLTRINAIEFPAPDEARLQITVGMVGREAGAASTWDVAAEVHDFAITMRKQGGEWKVVFARRENGAS